MREELDFAANKTSPGCAERETAGNFQESPGVSGSAPGRRAVQGSRRDGRLGLSRQRSLFIAAVIGRPG